MEAERNGPENEPGLTLADANVLLGRHPHSPTGADTAADLLRWMDRFGIAEAVVGHTASWLHDPAAGNRMLTDALGTASGRLRPCWAVLPGGTGELGEPDELVAGALAAGVVAARGYPADHGWSLGTPDATPLLRALAGAGLPLLLDAEQTSWTEITACATDHPELRLVVCRTGYRALRRIAGVLGGTGNVWIETSTLTTHQGLEWLAGRFGTQRLLFGTGAMLQDPAEAVTRLLLSGLDDTAVRAIGGANLRRLLTRPGVRAGMSGACGANHQHRATASGDTEPARGRRE
ncbi:amidohydrolase family protein [Actinophytocola sp.]|uniref:amidohydrolase family protein n=1 Tax=Actinophytocola sp. TaxID=1872138 RepID=UPI003D6B9589